MAASKPVGYVESVRGEVMAVGSDGTIRIVTAGTPLYEGELLIGQGGESYLNVNYSMLPEPAEYAGIFRIALDADALKEGKPGDSISEAELASRWDRYAPETAAGNEGQASSSVAAVENGSQNAARVKGDVSSRLTAFNDGDGGERAAAVFGNGDAVTLQRNQHAPEAADDLFGAMDSITAEGVQSVTRTYFSVTETTTVTISTNGATIDPVMYLFRDDGSLDGGDYIASNDDGGTPAGAWYNSVITVTLAPGEYVAVVSDYSFSSSEAISGLNSNDRTGEIAVGFSPAEHIVLRDFESGTTEETVTALDILANDTDRDDTELSDFTITLDTDSLTVNGVALPFDPAMMTVAQVDGHAQLIFNAAGRFDSLRQGETAIVTIDYTVTDAPDVLGTQFTSDPARVTIIVAGTNDAPVARDVTITSATATEGIPDAAGALMGTLDADDADNDNSPTNLSYSVVSGPEGGTVLLFGNQFLFSPADDFQELAPGETATVSFTYVATDRHGASSNEATVTLQVTGTNDAPVVEDVTVGNAIEGVPAVAVGVTGTFAGDDVDSDDTHESLVFSMVDAPAVGSVTIDGDSFTYHPGDGFQELSEGETTTVSFTYKATDSHGMDSAVKTVTVTIEGTNDAPVVADVSDGIPTTVGLDTFAQPATTYNAFSLEDGAYGQRFVATGETLSQIEIDLVDGSTGSLALQILDSDGQVVYTSALYDVTGSGDNVVAIDLDAALTPGELYDMRYYMTNDSLRAEIASALDSTDNVGYLYNGHLYSHYDFRVKMTYSSGEHVILEGDGVATVYTGQLEVEDIDLADGHDFALSGTPECSDAGVTNLAVVVLSDGSYTVAGNFDLLADGETATVTFEYTATDDSGTASAQSNAGTVTLTVTGTNDAPVVQDVTVDPAVAVAIEGVPAAAGTLTAAFDGDDADGDNDASDLVYSVVTAPAAGSVTVSGSQFTFDPGSDFQALAAGETTTVSFTYKATDVHGVDSDVKTVTLTVEGTNDAPVARDVIVNPAAAVATEGVPAAAGTLTGIFDADDVDSDNTAANLVYSVVTAPAAGSVTVSGNQFTFDPGSDFQELAAGETTTVSFTYKATDVHGAESATKTVTLTVEGTNDAPVFGAEAAAFELDGGYAVGDTVGTVTAGDVDNGDTLTYSIFGGDAAETDALNARFAIDANGVITVKDAALLSVEDGNPASYTLGIRVTDVLGATDEKSATVAMVPGVAVETALGTATPESSTELMVNGLGDGLYYPQVVQVDDDGSYVVLWYALNKDGDANYGLFAQRFSAFGEKAGDEIHINTTTSYSQWDASIEALGDGKFVVAWESQQYDSSGGNTAYVSNVYMNIFGSDDAPLFATDLRVNNTAADYYYSDGGRWSSSTTDRDEYLNPEVTAFDDGSFAVAMLHYDYYRHNETTISNTILVQHYTADGDELGGETAALGNGTNVTYFDMFAQGATLVIVSVDQTQNGVAVTYDAAGNVVSTLNLGLMGSNVRELSTELLADGSYVVTWHSSNDAGDEAYGIFAKIVAADGTVGATFHVNTVTDNNQQNPAVTQLADGNIVIAWEGYDDGNNGGAYTDPYWGVYAQIFDAAGNRIGGEIHLNTLTVWHQQMPELMATEDGGFIAVWGSTDGTVVYQQSFDAMGNPLSSSVTMPLEIAPTFENMPSGADIAVTVSGLPDGASLSAGVSAGDPAVWTLTQAELSGLNIEGMPVDTPFELDVTVSATTGGETVTALSSITADSFSRVAAGGTGVIGSEESFDVFHVMGDDSVPLDISDAVAANMQSIEQVELHGGDYSLEHLSVSDVVTMTDSEHTLVIDGQAGDSVTLESEWNPALNSSVQINAADGYVSYTLFGSEGGVDAVLKVSDQIDVYYH